MTRAFVFPGQGSQAVGMGRDLAEAFATARQTFEEIDDALHQRLSRLMFEGPEGELTLTENAQPALMAVSLAIVRVMERDGGIRLADKAAFVAGHSLGEYSALAAAGTFALGDAARLLKRRGQAMQRAVPVGAGAMAALLGLDIETAREVAEAAAQGEVCTVANDNAPGQVVVSGHKAAVERTVPLARERGGRHAVLLPVSAPFHCPLMQPAADEMAQALAAAAIAAPRAPVVANVTARPAHDPEEIRRLLVEQVTGRVRWRESVLWMAAEGGVTRFAEAGAGKVLTGMVKRLAPDAEALALNAPADLEAFAKSL
jgi:[acyl-carrier-protein] S-malonyltransferase